MGFKSSYLLCLTIFLAVSSSIHAFDIIKSLADKPDYATFSKYLTETKLVDQINSRKIVTVLVVNNDAMSAISGKSPELIKSVMSTHVLLDYYDEKNLIQDVIGKNQPLTSLNQPGSVKVALIGEGSIAFGSAASGAPAPDAEVVQPVVSEPSIFSIIEVSKLIMPSGLLDSKTQASPSTGQAPAAAKTPTEGAKAPVASAKAPAASAKAPVSTEGAKSAAPTEGAKAPAPTEEAKAPTKSAEAPTHDAKAAAPTTEAETPSEAATAPSPSEVVADSPPVAPSVAPTTDVGSPSMTPGPAGGEAAADAATPSSSSRTIVGFVGAVMCFASLFVVM